MSTFNKVRLALFGIVVLSALGFLGYQLLFGGSTGGNPESVPSIDGRPSLLIWSLTGDIGFF